MLINKALIIGYGSIGQRHDCILSDLLGMESVSIVSRQSIKKRTVYGCLEECDLEKYSYFVIASETKLHYEQLTFINSKVKNKTILVEKPLFGFYKDIDETYNKIYVGYNMRFHPVLVFLKKILAKNNIFSMNVICGSYLPDWRSNRDYRDVYSSKKDKLGGVHFDLSHEFDYAQWLSGNIIDKVSYVDKISNLEINSYDTCQVIAKTEKNILLNISLNYFTNPPVRLIILDADHISIQANLISNEVNYVKDGEIENKEKFSSVNRNLTYELMHKSILDDKTESVCGLKEGMMTDRLLSDLDKNSKKILS